MARITLSSPLTDAETTQLNDLDIPVLRELLAASDKAAASFGNEAGYFGIDADAGGVEFVSKNRRFRFTGINPKAPKFPVQATILDGTDREFRFHRSIAATINAAAAKRRVSA